MAALHYASYFDVGPVLTALLITSKVNFINSVNKVIRFFITFIFAYL